MDTYLPLGRPTSLLAFKTISPDIQQLLIQNGEIVRLAHHQLIFEQNELAQHFYLVIEGLVKLVRFSENKQSHLLDLIAPGESIGLALMHEKALQAYPISAQCLKKTEILILTRDYFFNFWKKNNCLIQYGSEQIQKRLFHFQDSLCMQNRSLPERLAHLLTEKIYPIKHQAHLTRRDLAECVGASTEAVIRLLSLWTQQGLITTENRQIIFHDLQKLRDLWAK